VNPIRKSVLGVFCLKRAVYSLIPSFSHSIIDKRCKDSSRTQIRRHLVLRRPLFFTGLSPYFASLCVHGRKFSESGFTGLAGKTGFRIRGSCLHEPPAREAF
jgi:hypothetical protein